MIIRRIPIVVLDVKRGEMKKSGDQAMSYYQQINFIINKIGQTF